MQLHIDQTWHVCEYRKVGAELQFVGKVSGLGLNKGTWDAEHSRRTAQRHAKALREAAAGSNLRYYVETNY